MLRGSSTEPSNTQKEGGKKKKGLASRMLGGVRGGHVGHFGFFWFLLFENYLGLQRERRVGYTD